MPGPGRKKLAEHLKLKRPGAVPGTAAWTLWVRDIEQALGHAICAAGPHENRPYPCPNPQALGTRRCKSHGAKTALGPANPAWRNGRSSILLKKAPTQLKAGLKASLEDPNLLELRPELAMLDARVGELWERLKEGGSNEAWEQMRTLVGDLALALAEDDADQLHAVATAMSATVDQHFDEVSTWHELRETAKLRARITGEERKRLQVLHGFVRAERVNFFLMYLVESLASKITNHEELAAVLQDIRRLMPTGGIESLDPGMEIPA